MDGLRWAVFALAVLAMNFPVISTFVTSPKSEAEISASPSLWVRHPTFENYRAIFAMQDPFDILHFLANSLITSLLGSILTILLAFPAAYGMARHEVGRKWLLPLVVNLRAVPLIIFAIPIYLIYQWLGLLDTRLGLGLMFCLVNVPLALVLFSAAIAQLLLEIEDAARVDGANTLRLLIHIVAPMSLNIFAAASVLAFINSWNEFLFGLMLTTSRATPVSVGASFFFAASGGGVRWGVAAAVIILPTLPPLMLGLSMYRVIGKSMTSGAVKG